MLFNSFIFAVFFSAVFAVYWFLPFRLQNYLLLTASLIFYGYWDWRFLFLLCLPTVIDYFAALQIEKEHAAGTPTGDRKAKWWVGVCMVSNLTILGFFKYYNFFIDSFNQILSPIGLSASALYLEIVLPVGISFYTFQTMSYTIDVYRKEMKPTRSFPDFLLFVTFFPQLVAGPIERAKDLLPRILTKRKLSLPQIGEGLELMLWGYFKKVFIADNLAPIVQAAFAAPEPSFGHTVVGTFAFAFQIYCDFSGYSDIARGLAKCLGFELMINFRFPYIATNPSDFWKRWHISLSSWLRDYLYIPLGGNRGGAKSIYRNLIFTMLLGGLWHGASWIFVIWGAYQGALLVGHRLSQNVVNHLREGLSWRLPRIPAAIKIVVMFHLVCFGWLIFRSQSVGQLLGMAGTLLQPDFSGAWTMLQPALPFIAALISLEFLLFLPLKRRQQESLYFKPYLRTACYALMFYMFAFYGASAQDFIYFQF